MSELSRLVLAATIAISIVAVSIARGSPAHAREPAREFQPNYIAAEDVALSSPNGKPRGSLKKGTLVAARVVGDGVLDLKTEDGEFGLAPLASFHRLGSSVEITEEARKVAESSNRFAFDLYQQIRPLEGNLFLSPASISTALAMTRAGAVGQTKLEMGSVLHLDLNQNMNDGFSTLLDLMNTAGDRNGYTLSTANRLWGAAGYEFEDSFLRLTRDKYRAELETVNFGQPERARRTINGWVAKQTRDKIVDLIPQGILQPDTPLVLTNAIYFEGGWSSEFSEDDTKPAPFRLSADEKVTVPMMEQSEHFSYAEEADVQLLSMAYRGYEVSMIVALPRKVDGLAKLESELTYDRFVRWTEKLQGERPVELYLPKFKMESQFMLSKVLQEMGMTLAFSEEADFSAMSTAEDLLISEVIHRAFVDVSEKGTEAAAATAVLIAPTAQAPDPNAPSKPVIFRADHPFLFVIQDDRTGAVLFVGRVQRPEES